MNLKDLWREKWFRYGVPVAGGAGLLVLIMRKRATGSTSASGATAPAYATGGGGIASFDSTPNDVAHWLGSYSAGLQSQLDNYARSIDTEVSTLTKIGSTAPLHVNEGTSVESILSGIRSYLPDYTMSDLLALNPGLTPLKANSRGYIDPSTNPERPGESTGFYINAPSGTLINIPTRPR